MRTPVLLAITISLTMTGVAAAKAVPTYPRMAPVSAYLMDRTKEIALARSAAPPSVSKNATILVLTRTGYKTAITGTNGFVCRVGRGFSGAFDWPERWNPKIRAAECLNPEAARSVLPYSELTTRMALLGDTNAEIIDRIELAVRTKVIPSLEPGAMSYMMSKSSYLTDAGAHDMPHVMFFIPLKDGADWGANGNDTPVFGGNYWFLMPGNEASSDILPTLSVYLSEVPFWSDGTPASAHPM